MYVFQVRARGPILAAALGLAVAPGCATIASKGGGDQTITVASNPPGATVLVDGNPAGFTPAELKLSRHTEHKVAVAAPGYETAEVTVRRKFNPWVLGNIPIGLVGALVDVATDTTHKLSPSEVQVNLIPEGAVTSVPNGGGVYPASAEVPAGQ